MSGHFCSHVAHVLICFFHSFFDAGLMLGTTGDHKKVVGQISGFDLGVSHLYQPRTEDEHDDHHAHRAPLRDAHESCVR